MVVQVYDEWRTSRENCINGLSSRTFQQLVISGDIELQGPWLALVPAGATVTVLKDHPFFQCYTDYYWPQKYGHIIEIFLLNIGEDNLTRRGYFSTGEILSEKF